MKECITLSWEGVQSFLSYAILLENVYMRYIEAGKKLNSTFELVSDEMDVDGDEIRILSNKYTELIKNNASVLQDMHNFCKKEAMYMSTLLTYKVGGVKLNMPYSSISASQKLTAYMAMHNYGINDFNMYMQDPEWQKLSEMSQDEREKGIYFENDSKTLNEFKEKIIGKNLTSDIEDTKILIKKPNFFSGYESDVKYNATFLGKVQGYFELPRLVSEKEFNRKIKESGIFLCRALFDGVDVITKKEKSAVDFKKDFIFSENIVYNGNGGMRYGPGIYMTGNSNPQAHVEPSIDVMKKVEDEARFYGDVCIKMTLDSSAKIADGYFIRGEYDKLVEKGMDIYGDANVYAIALGYDGIRNERSGSDNVDYYTIFNRSAIIVLDDM